MLPKSKLSDFQKAFSFMKPKEKFTVFCMVLIFLASCVFIARTYYINHTEPVKSTGGIYREGLIGQPRLINPLLATSSVDNSVSRLVFAGLLKYDKAGNLVPDLAEDMPKVSDDGKTYIISLKAGLKWHDGKNLTAEDIAYTASLISDPDYKNSYINSLTGVSVTPIDSTHVSFSLKNASLSFLHTLTFPIMPQHIWEKVEKNNFALSEYNLNAVGSGKFAVSEIKKLKTGKITSITLKAADKAESERAFLDQIILEFYDEPQTALHAFQSKEINGLQLSPKDIADIDIKKDLGDGVIEQMLLPQYYGVFFNVQSAVTSDLNVRKALSLATDKTEVTSIVQGKYGSLISSPILDGHPGFIATKQAPIVDLENARILLDAAGFKINTNNIREKAGKELSINLYTNDSSSNVKAAQALKASWEKLNLKVNLTTLASKDLVSQVLKNRDFDALFFAESTGPEGDPYVFWHSSQAKYPGLNLTGFANTDLDKLIIAGRDAKSYQERANQYAKVQTLLDKSTPAIFLFQAATLLIHSPEFKDMEQPIVFDVAYRYMNADTWNTATSRKWKSSEE